MSSVIELTNVIKTYTMGDTTFNALDGVTVAIQKGDFAAIVGPSGSGKSTLMHIIGILDDEPTGNLDSKSGKEIIEFFNELNDLGNTIVLVTHSPEIARVAKRIIEIKDGKIERDTKRKR